MSILLFHKKITYHNTLSDKENKLICIFINNHKVLKRDGAWTSSCNSFPLNVLNCEFTVDLLLKMHQTMGVIKTKDDTSSSLYPNSTTQRHPKTICLHQ